MNAVSIACPRCGAQYKVKADNIGKKARCPKCSEAFVLSLPPDTTPVVQETESGGLLTCPYCGFHDSGYFCSNCGGRLTGQPTFDLESCKVPRAYLSRLPAELRYDLDGPPQKHEEERRRYEMRQNCEHFNQELDEMARVIRYQGLEAADWHFNRLSVGRLVDSLPPDVPARDEIVTRLWTMVSDVERTATAGDIDALAGEVRQCIGSADSKKAGKALAKLREVMGDAPMAENVRLLAELESQVERLQSEKVNEKQSAAFQKLLDKADKLAFQQESKKAVKAYQECLFWLSRNELPGKGELQANLQEKLRTLGGDGAG